ncbi:hypothetical protein PTD2_14732 [Pseudoalteromonas tunicata D2]|uniref:Uncharacterized protein n=1 Tax=Pseudoalteromonas tunicata D2 TaxID=87626 RepID=A4CCL1_9GAMM|nr:hypothetical protein PTD2_14732 [Pseudoalteromonas tunicata D2]
MTIFIGNFNTILFFTTFIDVIEPKLLFIEHSKNHLNSTLFTVISPIMNHLIIILFENRANKLC